jgi:hypothetical protein
MDHRPSAAQLSNPLTARRLLKVLFYGDATMSDIDPGTGHPPTFTQASEQGSDTGTDGYVPQPLDKALLGGRPQLVGTFEYRYDTDTWSWSDTVARLHGYEPGTVQPTTELVLSHKHPDDLAEVKGLLKQSAAPFSSRHRIRTVSGESRRVVVARQEISRDKRR